jgi:hypothetical protein
LDKESTRSVSSGRLELSNSIQRLFSQRRRVARDCDLADTLEVRHTTVERRDQLTQATKCALSILCVANSQIALQTLLKELAFCDSAEPDTGPTLDEGSTALTSAAGTREPGDCR